VVEAGRVPRIAAPLRRQVFEQLRELIVGGAFGPVTELSAADTRARYDVRMSREGWSGCCSPSAPTSGSGPSWSPRWTRWRRLSNTATCGRDWPRRTGSTPCWSTGPTTPMVRQILRGLSLQTPGRPERALAELRRIAATAGDGDATRIACAEHVRQAGRLLLATLQARADP
jgi:hypothetical protein